MNQIKQYIIALSNLYGMVHKDKVVEIYNGQNEDQITISDVKDMFIDYPVELVNAFIHTYKNYFVMEAIIDDDQFDEMLRKKSNKPYYVPERDELLRYIKDGYIEKTKQYYDVLSYLKTNFFKPGDEKAVWLADDIQGLCHVGANFQTILICFEDREISFEDINQVNEIAQLITELSNNTRIWENNGHTPREIFEKFEKPNLRPLPSKPFQFGRSSGVDVNRSKTIGRNDLCHCGSGKKYKKCCFGKDEK